MSPAIAYAIVVALLASLWQGTAIACTAWLAFALLERRSAALRHDVGMVFLLVLGLAPVVTFLQALGDATSVNGPFPVSPMHALPAWPAWLWCVGAGVRVVQLAFDWLRVRRMERLAFVPLPPPWAARCETLRRRLLIGRDVSFRIVQDVLPCSARVLRPVVWLPAALLADLPVEQVEAIVAHELAHIRRLDWMWNALQCVIEALLFYHPATWWIGRRIRDERENACDDLAALACGDPIVLAEALVALEGMRRQGPLPALAATGGSLMHRITRLLSPSPPQPARRGLALVVLGTMGLATAVFAAQSGPAPRDTTTVTATASSEIRTGDLDSHAVRYDAWTDAQGKRHERFLIDGRVATIDSRTRAWIEGARVVPPPPPALRAVEPPVPPAAPTATITPPPAPPALVAPPPITPTAAIVPPAPLPPIPEIVHLPPPPPPAPPSVYASTAWHQAMAIVRGDPQVRAWIGGPVSVSGMAGPSLIQGDKGDIHVAVSGPRGQRVVHVQRNPTDRDWHVVTEATTTNILR